MTTKKSSRLTLKDRLSRLTYLQACKLLGENGAKLIQLGAQYHIEIDRQVTLTDRRFELRLPGSTVTIQLANESRQKLKWRCSTSTGACEEVGAAFSLILEDKCGLGLAAPPEEELPAELLDEDQLVARAVAQRRERALKEKMRLKSTDPQRPWTDYLITSAESGRTYRLSLRGEEPGQSFCSCPDFRTNTLGTCKHLIHAVEKVRKKFTARQRGTSFARKQIEVFIDYTDEPSLRLACPARLDANVKRIVAPLENGNVEDASDLVRRISSVERKGVEVNVFPDAAELIEQRLFQDRIAQTVSEIRAKPARHPLRSQLLKTELLPYQLDGIAFAVGAGRAILADDMGLGKTIQGIGVAELLSREADISKVLVICPASLKSQWKSEIARFSSRDCQLVVGSAENRAAQYDNDCFFTVCNYEQVLRDILSIESIKWDLIILDEGQRIKNWEAKTSAVVKGLRSPFALVLSGTPLENRLDELYSVVQFIDDRRLAPAFRFFHRHRVVNENGKVLGYKNLGDLRRNLEPILLRRTRDQVMKQLPERTNHVVRIEPTEEQFDVHQAHMQVVSTIIRKKFLTEMDLLRLQKALLMCRMACNSTFLVDKQEPSYSSKLERLEELLSQLADEPKRKIVLFSEWTTMLNLIEPRMTKNRLDFVRLDGSVPQRKRQTLVDRFQTDASCRAFLTTNAGSTGLNLQAADTVINVDLPWNPAILEQRIARAHRMGQKRPVQVYVMVTEGMIEENLLSTLSAKHALALAALDMSSEVDELALEGGMDELKRRLETLLGAKPEAPVDVSQETERRREIELTERRRRVSEAGGELLGAAFRFLGELVAEKAQSSASEQLTGALKQQLSQCVDEDEQGRTRLTVTLPGRGALDDLAESLARLLAVK